MAIQGHSSPTYTPTVRRYVNVTDRQRTDNLRQLYRALYYVHRAVKSVNVQWSRALTLV